MAKTYEIWRRADPLSDRYDIASYAKILDVTPLNEVVLNTSRYEDEEFYRSELGNTLTFGAADFYKLLCIKYDPLVNDMTYIFVIMDGASVYWSGFISLQQGNWNEDECTVSLSTNVLDEYTSILSTAEVKINLLAEISTRETFYGETNEWAEWKAVCDTDPAYPPTPDPEAVNNWQLISYQHASLPNLYFYTRKRASCLINNSFNAVVENTVTKYVGNYLPIDPATLLYVAACGSPPSPISNYYELWDGQDANCTNCVWILRSALDDPTQVSDQDSVDYTDAVHIDDVIDAFIDPHGLTYTSQFFNNANNPITGTTNKLSDLLFLQGSNAGDPDASDKARIMDMTFNQFRLFLRDLNARWYIDSGVFYIEHLHFFENNLSYSVAKTVGIDATLKTDTRSGAYSIAKTNKYEYVDSRIYRFEEFSWTAAETKNFVGTKIYYDNETVNSKTDDNTIKYGGVVFTDFPYVLAKGSEIPKDSIFVVAGEPDGGDFKVASEASLYDGYIEDLPIYESTNQTSGLLVIGETYELTNWITDDDFTNVGATVNADGVIFVATGTTPTKWTNSSLVSKVRPNNLPNNHLSWGNLHETYFKYGRVFLEGIMNDVDPTTFLSIRPFIKQVDIAFPLCPDTFDPLKLIKTNIGDGEVITASENMRTGVLTTVLEHRTIDNPRSCVCLVPQLFEVGTFIVGADCQEIS